MGVNGNGRARKMADAIGESAGMKTANKTLRLDTSAAPEFIDITQQLKDFVAETKVQNGHVVVYSRHTTAAVIINENEPLLLDDMRRRLEAFAPRNDYYKHNDFSIRTVNLLENEPPNGHAHCQHILLGSSQTIPIVGGKPHLGRWQSVFFLELDSPRPREVLFQVLGV
jgi:secondary thiamine-phosphate synthase enzyme